MKNYSTEIFEDKTRAEIRDYVHSKYRRVQGESVYNLDRGVLIRINKDGRKKTAKPLMSKQKGIIVLDIKNVLQECIYSNWGSPKPSHVKTFKAKGFLNFQYKCKIDGIIKNFRISVIITNEVTFQYSLEHNNKN